MLKELEIAEKKITGNWIIEWNNHFSMSTKHSIDMIKIPNLKMKKKMKVLSDSLEIFTNVRINIFSIIEI